MKAALGLFLVIFWLVFLVIKTSPTDDTDRDAYVIAMLVGFTAIVTIIPGMYLLVKYFFLPDKRIKIPKI
jgi:uncharacterized membrane protein